MTTENIKEAAGNSLMIYAVGDVTPNRENPESIFALCSSTLHEADIRFCQLETCISARGVHDPSGPAGFRLPPKDVSCLTHTGFNIISLNGNHSMGWGPEAFIDTIDILEENGIQVLGVGKNIDDARKPRIIECNGTRIAFLAFNSVGSAGFWAGENRPGGVPMRIHTYYEPVENFPGGPGIVHTCPNSKDLMAMRSDIQRAKLLADIVVVSYHAGILFIRSELPEYQKEVCYVAIDAGADIVLNHHAHILKGIEVYKGKVIFYGIGDFAFEHPPEISKAPQDMIAASMKSHMDRYGLKMNTEDPNLAWFPSDSRKSMIAKIMILNKEIEQVSFLPVMINKQCQPEVMKHGDKGFDEVLEYIIGSTREVGMDTHFRVEGDEVLVIS